MSAAKAANNQMADSLQQHKPKEEGNEKKGGRFTHGAKILKKSASYERQKGGFKARDFQLARPC